MPELQFLYASTISNHLYRSARREASKQYLEGARKSPKYLGSTFPRFFYVYTPACILTRYPIPSTFYTYVNL